MLNRVEVMLWINNLHQIKTDKLIQARGAIRMIIEMEHTSANEQKLLDEINKTLLSRGVK
jgi:hypothetical protein